MTKEAAAAAAAAEAEAEAEEAEEEEERDAGASHNPGYCQRNNTPSPLESHVSIFASGLCRRWRGR
jgi:hypothetical protein